MSYEERIVTRRDEGAAGHEVDKTVVRSTTTGPSGPEVLRRVVIFLFGIVQALIIARIALLLLNAREGNEIVASVLNASQIFVAPFEGIFQTDALGSGEAILDVAALAALIGWTLLEMLVLAAISIFRREPV